MSQGLKTSVRWMQQLAIPVAVLLLLSFARPVLAAEPQERMREILNAVAAVLKDPSLQGQDKQAERQQRVRQIILDTFDFEEMAKLALGPSWERLTPQQRTEFVSLFGNLFERSYNTPSAAVSARAGIREEHGEPMIRSQELDKRVAKLITCICLLSFLLSVCCSGCGIGRPPVWTLEQWEADRNRTRSRSD